MKNVFTSINAVVNASRKLALALALAACGATPASAGMGEGIVNVYQRATDGLIVAYLSGTNSGRPSCAQSQTYWIVKDENSAVGKGHFAMLLAARLAGKSVRIVGANTCTRWGDGEDIEYIQILD